MSHVGRIILGDSTESIRFLLAIVATIWAAILWVPLARPGSEVFAVHNAQLLWAALWSSLAILKFWRIFGLRRPIADVVVHSFSVVMFSSSILATYHSLSEIPADIADDVGCTIASLWALMRTAQTTNG